MLEQCSHEIGEEAADDHGQHVNASHESTEALNILEVERDPEGEDWKADESSGEYNKELGTSKRLRP